MNYINKGKRDILIFPQFDNIDKIQNIRNRYDELSQILPPHITLAFPFKIDLKNDEIRKKLSDICKSYNRFNIKCKGISFIKDKKINKYYIFLNIVEENDIIRNISIDIYHKLLNKDLPQYYIPHITLGSVDEIIDIDLKDCFETEISKIAVESIGDNEESFIDFYVSLER